MSPGQRLRIHAGYKCAADCRDLLMIIEGVRNAVPDASILLVGPPDCDRLRRPFRNLRDVIAIQRQVARETGCAFWNGAAFMDENGGRRAWVRSGLSQPDGVHLTPQGYRLLGETFGREILRDFHRAEPCSRCRMAVRWRGLR